jgi:hypothetical protein
MNIYKYLHPDRVDVLESLRIRFSPAVSMNDAFELKPLTKGWASPEFARPFIVPKFEEYFAKIDTPEKMLKLITANHPEAEPRFRANMAALGAEAWLNLMKQIIIANFVSGADEVHALVENNWSVHSKKVFDLLGTQLGILSLSEDPRHPVMWGNYADCSRGFVIGFDSHHPWFNQPRSENDDFCQLTKVTYIDGKSPKYLVELTAQDAVYSKLSAWSYEEEWRMIMPLVKGVDTGIVDTFGQPVILFPFPADCITEVIVGSRCTNDLSEKIEGLCQGISGNIRLQKGQW